MRSRVLLPKDVITEKNAAIGGIYLLGQAIRFCECDRFSWDTGTLVQGFAKPCSYDVILNNQSKQNFSYLIGKNRLCVNF